MIGELEGKRNDPEIGYFARQALRNLDELRVQHDRLDFPVPVGDGGIAPRRAEPLRTWPCYPAGSSSATTTRASSPSRCNLANDGLDVTVVSKDLPMRVKAASIGLTAEEYRAEQAVDSGWTGIGRVALSGDEMSDLYENEVGIERARRSASP